MTNQSTEIKDLAAALCRAQMEIGGAVKDSKNPFFKSAYADLESVCTAIRGPLTKNGLAFTQTTDVRDGQMGVVTTLMHTSGQWISGFYPVSPVKNDPQAVGSAVTYARRYALAAICGVYQTDDDGESAMNRPTFPNGRVAPNIKPEQPGPNDGDPNAKYDFRMRVGGKKGRGLPEIEKELGGLPAMVDWLDESEAYAEKQHKLGKMDDAKYRICREDFTTVAAYITRREGEMERDVG